VIVFAGSRALATLALILMLVVAAVACMPPIVMPSERPSPTLTPSQPAAPSEVASAVPTSPPSPSVRPLALQTKALGALTGQWIFVGKEIASGPSGFQRDVQIWAVPLDGGSPVQAVSYSAGVSMISTLSDLTPYLRRQFSPDGARLVLSVDGELVIVDLSSGQVRRMGTQGVLPAWSKDGSQIAYVNWATQSFVNLDSRIWIVPVGGGPGREIPAPGGINVTPVEWSPDSTQLLVASAHGIDVIDARSGGIVRHLNERAWAFGHWRSATPQIALPTVTAPGAPVVSRLVALDSSLAPERVLLESTQTFDAGGVASPSIWFSDPRWSPVGNEILYIETHQTGTGPSGFKTHVYELSSGRDNVIPVDAYQATWTWDGRRIVYLTPSVAFRNDGSSLRIANRDGSGSRELLGGGDDKTFFFNVASLNY
jgi:dipeptidyl aminopeptidase/acylaminoacyl peptidase